MGESYGAVLALRWQAVEPRVGRVVAIAPYAVLSNTVMNLRQEYASWLPKSLIRAGVRQLPTVLDVPAGELDTTTILARSPHPALFVAGTNDKIAPAPDVAQLQALAGAGSRLIVVPEATHETLTYYFQDLAPPVLNWLAPDSGSEKPPAAEQGRQ